MSHEKCGQLLGELSAYLDGDASEELCRQIEHHLEECHDCRVVVDTLRKTVDLMRVQPSPGLPKAARERLYRSLDLSDLIDQ